MYGKLEKKQKKKEKRNYCDVKVDDQSSFSVSYIIMYFVLKK